MCLKCEQLLDINKENKEKNFFHLIMIGYLKASYVMRKQEKIMIFICLKD